MQQLVSFFIPVVVVLSACGVQAQTFECPDNAELAIEAMDRVTDVVVHDIFTPPVSSRIYAYTSLAAYSAYEWAGGKTPFTVALNDFPATDA